MQINTDISDGEAREGEGLDSLEVCVDLGGGSADEIEDDVVIPLIVVDGKAGMLSLNWLISVTSSNMDGIYSNICSSQMLQI